MLYKNRTKQEKQRRRIGIICSVVILAAVITGASYALKSVNQNISEQSLQSVKTTVLKSAVQCYAVEGSYPESLSYLEENYGLLLNHNRYIVTYDVFASNVLPEVMVLQR